MKAGLAIKAKLTRCMTRRRDLDQAAGLTT
jgi:hypothetical protein